jgi:lysophospholipase L1-like esterase
MSPTAPQLVDCSEVEKARLDYGGARGPSHIQADFDSGDHLHPNDAGYKAMADSIDLRLLTEQP